MCFLLLICVSAVGIFISSVIGTDILPLASLSRTSDLAVFAPRTQNSARNPQCAHQVSALGMNDCRSIITREVEMHLHSGQRPPPRRQEFGKSARVTRIPCCFFILLLLDTTLKTFMKVTYFSKKKILIMFLSCYQKS